MAKVTVTPEQFELVEFDAAEIAAVAADVADAIGLGAGVEVAIEVDETAMQGKASARVEDGSGDGKVVVEVTGGAFESLKRTRTFDEARARAVLGQALMRVRDRLDPAFGEAPADDDLPVTEDSAWATSIEGRLDRLGILTGRPQRRIYHFRVRHGFSDTVDRVFDRLWNADALTWADIQAASAEAAGSTAPAS